MNTNIIVYIRFNIGLQFALYILFPPMTMLVIWNPWNIEKKFRREVKQVRSLIVLSILTLRTYMKYYHN